MVCLLVTAAAANKTPEEIALLESARGAVSRQSFDAVVRYIRNIHDAHTEQDGTVKELTDSYARHYITQ